MSLVVSSTDNSKFQFVPARLNISIGQINEDFKTVDVFFELRDNGEFDTALYKNLERVQRGNMNIPVELVNQLINVDGTYNYAVINQILAASFLST